MNDKLQKLLAHAGLGSRREIETWISDGRISVNGRRAKLGDRAAAADRILLDGKLLALTEASDESLKALIYHKPEGEICSRKDPKGRPSIFDNLPAIPRGRWVSVGRLDLNTSGLILLTNSGELANKLMHPSTGLEREYLVRIRGKASEHTLDILTGKGVLIDGKPARFDTVVSADMADQGTNHWYRVVIREGRYREVRRMWGEVGHTVSRLKRIRYGTIKLTRDIKRGQHRKIAPMQLEKMIASLGLDSMFAGQLYSSSRSSGSKSNSRPVSRRDAAKRGAMKGGPRGAANKSRSRANSESGKTAKPRGGSGKSRTRATDGEQKANKSYSAKKPVRSGRK